MRCRKIVAGNMRTIYVTANTSHDVEYTAEDRERLRLWLAYCANPTPETRAAYFDYQQVWRESKERQHERADV